MSVGTNLTQAQRAPPFVTLTVPKSKVDRSRFVATDHYSCVIFCFDIHS